MTSQRITKSVLRNIARTHGANSPLYVYAHGQWSKRRGRNPSLQWFNPPHIPVRTIRNPKIALDVARHELMR
jgi:hypothetical protein